MKTISMIKLLDLMVKSSPANYDPRLDVTDCNIILGMHDTNTGIKHSVQIHMEDFYSIGEKVIESIVLGLVYKMKVLNNKSKSIKTFSQLADMIPDDMSDDELARWVGGTN